MGFSLPFQIPMRAKVYQDGSRWRIILWWQGKQYCRRYYDDHFKLETKEMADFIAGGINNAIKDQKDSFRPSQFFASSGKDFFFSTYAEKWLNGLTLSRAMTAKLNLHTSLFSKHFQNQDIRQIKTGDILDFHKTILHFAPNTQRDYISSLKKIFRYAYYRQDLTWLPEFPTVGMVFKAPETISAAEQEKILAEIPAYNRPIFTFLTAYGTRPIEARELTWDKIDWDKRTITVWQSKTGRDKVLPLLDGIEALLKPFRGISGSVFKNRQGRKYTKAHMTQIWDKACKLAGVSINLYNGTKHSLGCRLVSQGYSLELVRQLFGHVNSDMTRRYAEVSVDAVRVMLENHAGTVQKQGEVINLPINLNTLRK